MSKRLLSIALAIVLVFTFTVPALAEETVVAPAFSQGTAEYARARDMVKRGATRAELVQYIYDELLLAGDLGEAAQFNAIVDYALRDVPRDARYATAVYTLYRAGILVGDDAFNRFFPDRKITEGEADAILFRAGYEPARRYVKLDGDFKSEDIYTLSNDAVFSIETFDRSGNQVWQGSGFFISADGIAVTCLHTLDDAYSAKAILADGKSYTIEGTVAYSKATNVALIKVSGKGFSWLPVANSDDVKVGATAYTLGAPFGLEGTISKGMVSYIDRKNDGRDMMQFTTSISPGSGGGPLLDMQGRVIGIASSSYTSGQKLNFAEPANNILSLKVGTLRKLSETRR